MGVRLLQQLVAEKTAPVVQAYMQHVQRAAAEKMRLALSRLENQVFSRTDHLDDGSPIAVKIIIHGEDASPLSPGGRGAGGEGDVIDRESTRDTVHASDTPLIRPAANFSLQGRREN